MTAPDPTSGERHPAEPRFAGPVATALPPLHALPLPSALPPPANPGSPTYAPQVEPEPGDAPIVSYGPEPFERHGLNSSGARLTSWMTRWAGSALAIGGGLLAIVGCPLTWATLRISALSSAATSVNDGSPDISYRGLTLLEGRAMLVMAAAAVGVSALLILRRLPRRRAAALTVGIGGAGLVLMGFTAIAHPAELATLFRSYQTVGGIRVHLPNGAGVWFATIGAASILVGGLLEISATREESQRSADTAAG